jgi:hypothetical protein
MTALQDTLQQYIDIVHDKANFTLDCPFQKLQGLSERYAEQVESLLTFLQEEIPSDVQSDVVVRMLMSICALHDAINATNDQELLEKHEVAIEEYDFVNNG